MNLPTPHGMSEGRKALGILEWRESIAIIAPLSNQYYSMTESSASGEIEGWVKGMIVPSQDTEGKVG